MAGSKNQKLYRAEMRRRAKEGFGHKANGEQEKLNMSQAMDRSLLAGYRLKDFSKDRNKK